MINKIPQFFIADTGIGINETNFKNIFDHFHKIETDGNTLYRGAGIGLTICKNLIAQMKGKIWLESLLNKGTTFYFSIPNKPKKNEVEEIEIIEEVNVPFKINIYLSKKTMLVAEDEPINFELIEHILKQTKANIIWAKNGKEAVEFIEKTSNHENIIVLMDIKMPVMDGVEAASIICKINNTIPIIAVTAFAHEDEKDKILENCFVNYISKPLIPEKLLSIISNYV
jgi:CheY-like chemotaxis protein